MLIKFMPKVEHLKCIMLAPKDGLKLERSMVQLIPGTNEVTDDEWKAMRGNIQSELDSGEIKILAQKLSAGAKAKNLKEMSAANAVRYVNECNSPETLKKWYSEITKEEVRLAITKRMQKLGVEPPEEKDDLSEEDETTDPDDDGEDETTDPVDEKKSESDSESLDEATLATMTVEELKAVCEKKGIDAKKLSKKSDLIEALVAKD
jgi:hypothetical protein